MKQILGRQTMLELYGCKKEFLNDVSFIEKVMVEAANRANATMVQQYFHQFSPHGVSGTIVIEESHINIHTWPEYDFAAIDIFTCNLEMEVDKACAYLKEILEAKKEVVSCHDRGNLAIVNELTPDP
ncbi:MAG: S-adenosylmethionine decarboxylase proenzyme [Granulosicoccus sp.]|jgi:S-adenosylmethionine decarboxylase proenzyme